MMHKLLSSVTKAQMQHTQVYHLREKRHNVVVIITLCMLDVELRHSFKKYSWH